MVGFFDANHHKTWNCSQLIVEDKLLQLAVNNYLLEIKSSVLIIVIDTFMPIIKV